MDHLDYEPMDELTFVEDPPDSKLQVKEETPAHSPIYWASPGWQHGHYRTQELQRREESFYLGRIAGLERRLNEIVLDSQKADEEWELFEVVMEREVEMKDREMSELKAQLAHRDAEAKAIKATSSDELRRKDEEIKKLLEQLANEKAAHALQREKTIKAESRINDMGVILARAQQATEEAGKKVDIERRAHEATKARLKAVEGEKNVPVIQALARPAERQYPPMDLESPVRLSSPFSMASAAGAGQESFEFITTRVVKKLPSRSPASLPPRSRVSNAHQLTVHREADSNSDSVEPARPKQRVMQTGSEIRWRGYGAPKKTPVPECTASDGYHHFSGAGTNQHGTWYTCALCHFSCYESKRRR